jgi:hypothetical protein
MDGTQMAEYLVIEDGKIWARIKSEGGADTARLRALVLKQLPHRAERLKNSIFRANINSPHQVMK